MCGVVVACDGIHHAVQSQSSVHKPIFSGKIAYVPLSSSSDSIVKLPQPMPCVSEAMRPESSQLCGMEPSLGRIVSRRQTDLTFFETRSFMYCPLRRN